MSSKNIHNYIFIDESDDPGKPFKVDKLGEKVETGASMYYILAGICVGSGKLFLLKNRILEIRQKYTYTSEIKSTTIPLTMYADLLGIINELELVVTYRVIDKKKYKGKFSLNGNKKLHNVFDEYHFAKLCKVVVNKNKLTGVDVVVDRADRKLLNGNFESFNQYLKSKINTKTKNKIRFVTHVDSEYVEAVQLADLVCGALKDSFTGKNKDLKKIIKRKYMQKVF